MKQIMWAKRRWQRRANIQDRLSDEMMASMFHWHVCILCGARVTHNPFTNLLFKFPLFDRRNRLFILFDSHCQLWIRNTPKINRKKETKMQIDSDHAPMEYVELNNHMCAAETRVQRQRQSFKVIKCLLYDCLPVSCVYIGFSVSINPSKT